MIESNYLHVALHGKFAGVLSYVDEPTSPENWSFAYEPDAPMAISLSMPLNAGGHHGAVASNWFSNLLPEGDIRRAVASRVGVSDGNEFALLEAIGRDCAGAVSLTSEFDPPARRGGEVLVDLSALRDPTRLLFPDNAPTRLSLAGAQDKLAVVRDLHGNLLLPDIERPSTHILKPASRAFRDLVSYEYFGLTLARAIGLDVPPTEILRVEGEPHLLIERYDRIAIAGNVSRIHQEDFCQVLGYPPELKYEAEGGPKLRAMFHALRAHRFGASSIAALHRWVHFNALLGNADAHAKNVSAIIEAEASPRVAPFYDLVPTVAWPESRLRQTLALKIGGEGRLDRIDAAAWEAFAHDAGLAARFVRATGRELAEAALATARHVAEKCVDDGARVLPIERALAIVAERARRLVDVHAPGSTAKRRRT